MRGKVRIGTSGWVYPHWRGVFYPDELAQREWFRHYAHVFDTVEVNNSFYRLPSESAFQAWRNQAPPGFVYAVKASRFITHMKKLKDPDPHVRLFFDRASHLREMLGPVLYQLPPRWDLNLARFEGFLEALPPRQTHVFEFRDARWLVEDVFALMAKYGAAHCIHDMKGLDVPARVTGRVAYVRFHGSPVYGGSYERRALELWAERIERWLDGGIDTFVYFNNDAGGHAVSNARALHVLVGSDVTPLV